MKSKYLTSTWIKEHWTYLILAPTFLGGNLQLFELASIGTPFVRFFSVSQLVSNGLIILFVFTLSYLTAWLILKESGIDKFIKGDLSIERFDTWVEDSCDKSSIKSWIRKVSNAIFLMGVLILLFLIYIKPIVQEAHLK